MLAYPADVERDGDGWFVRFPDVPEALTSGATFGQALEMAQDALETAMEFYFEDRRPVPMPSATQAGQALIALPVSLSAQVMRFNESLLGG